MIMQLQTGTVDYVCTDMPTAMAAVAKDDNLVILNFSGTDGDFQFASEEERAENVNIGISVQKGNTELTEAINSVLSTMTEDDFNALMDEAKANSDGGPMGPHLFKTAPGGVRAAREPNGAASRKARKNLCSRSNLYDLESLPWINW